jgi:hypothetical protein
MSDTRTAEKITSAVVGFRQAREAVERMPAGEAKVLAGLKLNRAVHEFARGIGATVRAK